MFKWFNKVFNKNKIKRCSNCKIIHSKKCSLIDDGRGFLEQMHCKRWKG